MKSQLKTLALVSAIALGSGAYADMATSANVMAPLEVSNWGDFENDLSVANSIGVTAVSVDVWWGKVEGAGDQQFDWSYYHDIFGRITNAGLDIVPIMSFHQCGGNVGDDCNVPIPGWIWTHYSSQGVSESDLKYKSEYGNEAVETVSLWRDEYVLSEYREFMEAFEVEFASYASDIIEINVSMGSAGELRYPSYNSHDGGLTDYPTRGGFQAYSDPAIEDFRDWSIEKYGSVNGVGSAWGLSLSSRNDINPPDNPENFINSGDHFNLQYGRDFIRWYHDALMDHGYRMMDNAIASFDGAFANIELGFKIPGIHWKMAATDNTVRSAEIAAGLLPTDVDLNSSSTGYGYGSIVSVAAAYNNLSRGVVLHFTALEMSDDPFGEGQSLAQTLVFWVANEAAAQGVTIKGENALSGGVTWDGGWDNIENAFANASYSGMTVLRINQVTDGGVGQQRYQQFIENYLDETDPPPPNDCNFSSLFVRGTNNGWTTDAMACVGNNTWEITDVAFGSTTDERFKFDVFGDWSDNYGDNNNDGIADAFGDDISVDADGVYTITFNDSTLAYEVIGDSNPPPPPPTECSFESLYVRGTNNGWATSEMECVGDNVWEITEVSFGSTSTERFKFDLYGDWSDNYGDNNNDGIADAFGDDIYVDANTTYTITFNDETLAYTLEEEGDSGPDPTTVSVTFTCNNGTTSEGTSVYVVGNHSDLGTWTVASNDQLLAATSYPTWSGTIALPANTSYEWKCVKANESSLAITQWQGGSNNTFSAGTSDISVSASF